MRIRVIDVLEMFAGGMTQAEILADYPYLEEDDIRASLAYAAQEMNHPRGNGRRVKFVVDAQLPPSLAQWLRAAAQGFILVTKDRDFVPSGGSHLSGLQIIWIRTGNVANRVLLDRLAAGWQRILEHLPAGGRVVELR